jgi:hypothetical protein
VLAVPALPVSDAERDDHARRQQLELLAGNLADQRLQLTEFWMRLVQAQQSWQDEYTALTTDLGTLAMRLPILEQELDARLQAVSDAEQGARDGLGAVRHDEQQLAARQARFHIEVSDWESQHQRLVADVQAREQLTQSQLAQIVEVRQRWAKRRRQELDLVRAERALCVKLRRECTSLRDELCRRGLDLQERERNLTQAALALEVARQESLGAGADESAGDRRLQKLEQQWFRQNEMLIQNASQQRQALQQELSLLDERFHALRQQTEQLAVREANLAERQAAWEHSQLQATVERDQLRQELASLTSRCQAFERQYSAAVAEVERLAHLLLKESMPLAA